MSVKIQELIIVRPLSFLKILGYCWASRDTFQTSCKSSRISSGLNSVFSHTSPLHTHHSAANILWTHPSSLVCYPGCHVPLYDQPRGLHQAIEVLGVTLAHAVHRGRAHQVVEARHLEPGDVLLEDVESHVAQVFCDHLLSDHGEPHLPARACVQLGVLSF